MPLVPINPNPDFSTNLTGWSGFGAAITRIDVSADPPPVGDTWAMRITPDGVTNTPRAFTSLTQITGIVPGNNYYARMVAKCNVERDVFFVVTWYTASNTVISSSTLFNSFEADVWDYWEGRITAPPNANKAQLVPQMPGVAPGTDLLDVAWCGFGVDFTSSGPLTFGTILSGVADGTGPRAVEFDLVDNATATGEKQHAVTAVPFDVDLAGTVAGEKVGVGAGLNLVPSDNPHVEENTTGWSPEGGTMDWVATPSGHPFPSSLSLKLTPDGVATTPHLNGPRLQGIVPGHEYIIRGWAWSPVSQQVRYRLTFYDAPTGDGQINIGASDVTINVSSITWTYFEATFVAPVGAVSARVKCRILNTPPTSNYVIFDGGRIVPKEAHLIQGAIVGGKDMSSGATNFGVKLGGTAQGLAQPDLVTFTDYPPLRARIRVYEPDGALRGQAPLPLSWSAAFPLNDLSSLTLEYLAAAPGAALLAAPCEVALELADVNNVFTEYPDCRFINIRQSQDLQDPAVTQSLSMPSYGWMLGKVRNINTAALNAEGNRVFVNVTVGAILNTMLNEAHARGNVPFLVADFNATTDSAGVPWGSVLSMSVGVGQDLLSLLRALTDQGQCDWRFNGRTLQAYKVDTFLNRDATTNPTSVVLHPNRDVTTAPDERSYEEIANTILVQGDENKYVTVEQAVNPSPWGDWETYMTQSGVTDTTVMQQLALRALTTANAPRTQMTRELMFRTGSPLPHINYRPGDRILAVDETVVYDTLRVRQITLQMNGEEFSGNVVLGDKFTENDIRVKRRISSLSNQAPIWGGSGRMPTKVPPNQEDTRVPNQVTNLALGSATFVDTQGITRGTISASWSPVTHATSTETIDIQTYRVRYAVQGTTNWRQISVDGSQTDALWGEGVNVLTTYTAQVAAVAQNGKQGAWSSAVNVFVQQDQVAPPVPSNPTATTRLGTIRVRWNGRDEDNLPMPIDFKHVEVEMSSTASGPWTPVGIIPASGLDLVIVDQPYNQARFFRLRSVDNSGNVSAYSGTVSVTTTPLVQTDIIGQILNGANIVPNSINAADKVIANTITGGLIQALAITSDKIAANAITADKITAGAITAEKVAAYSIDVSRLAIGGNGRNLIADAVASDAELNALRVTQSNGSPNSSSGLVWSDPGAGFFRMKPSTTVASGIARLNLLAYSATKPNLSNGSVPLQPKFCFPYDQDQGSLSASFQVKTSLASGTWPAGMSVGFRMYVRWVLKDGSNASVSQLVGTITHTGANDWATHTSQNFVIAPVDAVAVIPYMYITCTNVTTQLQVDVTNFFLAQKNGTVLIENGAITANQIAANTITAAEIAADAITAETLDATAITAKHTITGSVIQTGTSGHRVKMSPNANFLSQAGVTFYSGGSGGRNAYAFIDSGANEGEWGAYNFAIVGPEVTTNSSGRADLSLKIGGGLYLQKQYVNTAHSWSGMVCADTNNELLLGGTFPRGAPLPDTYAMMRFQTWPYQNATITWGIDIGWVFRGSIAPNHAGTTPRYGSVEFSSNTAFGYQCNGSVDTVYTMMWRGGHIG